MSKKILVAMSGGTDSSMAAKLLKDNGWQVSGVFIFFQAKEKVMANYQAARKVAVFLNIKLHTVDLSQDFEDLVVNEFVKEYRSGRTPNPCVRCNKFLKFGKLFELLSKFDCDYLATGHYVHIKNRAGEHKLVTAKDKTKDQSYFLYNLNQEVLKHAIFPLAKYTKLNIKKQAKKINLPIDTNKESNDVCFVNNKKINYFLNQHISSHPGKILNTQGEEIGQHQGLEFYTLGQRRGINIGGSGPYYVVNKDFEKNELIVTDDKKDERLLSSQILIKDVHWLSGYEPKLPLTCWAQHRYQTKKFKIRLERQGDHYLAITKKPQWAVTPGQSLVFYKPLHRFFNNNFEVLGGGVIE